MDLTQSGTGCMRQYLDCRVSQVLEAQALVQLAVALAQPLPELALLVPVTCSHKADDQRCTTLGWSLHRPTSGSFVP